MGIKKAITKKLQSEIEPILKTVNFFKKLFNKLIDLCFGWILRIAPKRWSNWWLSRPRKHRWIIGFCSFCVFIYGPTYFAENGFNCNSFWSFTLTPFFITSYFYSFLFSKNNYADWAWPEKVREEMKVFVETDFNKEGTWSAFFKNSWTVTPWKYDSLGRPIIWTCGDLMWKRIWHSMWIAAGIAVIPLLPLVLPFALIDKFIPSAQCLG